ncbi:MAG: hypothetical protein J6Y14_06820 [Fibrobacter sp.]|nr:hypothetical protein [Fibrobacter sp.]
MKKFFILKIFIFASHSFSTANVRTSEYHLQNRKNNAKRFYENLHAKKIPSQAEATGKPIAEPTSLGLKKQRQENIFRLSSVGS